MQHLHLGALIIDHDHGIPCDVRQVGGRDAHPAVYEILITSERLLELCQADDDEHPAELDFESED